MRRRNSRTIFKTKFEIEILNFSDDSDSPGYDVNLWVDKDYVYGSWTTFESRYMAERFANALKNAVIQMFKVS